MCKRRRRYWGYHGRSPAWADLAAPTQSRETYTVALGEAGYGLALDDDVPPLRGSGSADAQRRGGSSAAFSSWPLLCSCRGVRQRNSRRRGSMDRPFGRLSQAIRSIFLFPRGALNAQPPISPPMACGAGATKAGGPPDTGPSRTNCASASRQTGWASTRPTLLASRGRRRQDEELSSTKSQWQISNITRFR
jgi:hypothetical protein